MDPNLIPVKHRRVFPVFFSMQVEQPEDLDHLRYLLIARLREALEKWKQVPGGAIREMYRRFLQQVASVEVSLVFIAQLNVKVGINKPALDHRLNHDAFRQALLKTIDELEEWQFEGVCFLLDETEFIVRQAWADDAWGYFRGLKDTDTALKPFLGFVLAGYRDLKNYPQKVGSPLFNISDVEWLTTLTESETRALIYSRAMEEGISLSEQEVTIIIDWGGCHPYLTQQMLNIIFDDQLAKRSSSLNSLINRVLRQRKYDFSAWWNADNRADGFGDAERAMYRVLMANRRGTVDSLAPSAGLSQGAALDALSVLEGTGVIHQLKEDQYTIGAKLFERWVVAGK